MTIPDHCHRYHSVSYNLIKKDVKKCLDFSDFLYSKLLEFHLDNMTLTNEIDGKIRCKIDNQHCSVMDFYMELRWVEKERLINSVENQYDS